MGKDGDEGASKGEVKRGSLGSRRGMAMIQRMESFGIYDSLAPLAIWIPIIFCIIRQSLGYQGIYFAILSFTNWEMGLVGFGNLRIWRNRYGYGDFGMRFVKILFNYSHIIEDSKRRSEMKLCVYYKDSIDARTFFITVKFF